ncbi:hypothetical protein GOP47_0030382 [Adiantum capillus-veneris]|nr:hypothetical protein GOP47_0030382 [Adiantum capillus-veneris]
MASSSSLKSVLKNAPASAKRAISTYRHPKVTSVADSFAQPDPLHGSRQCCLCNDNSHTMDPLERIRDALREEMEHRSMFGSASPSSCKVALLGGPGVGKGTWGSLMAERLSIPHISTGELVRAELAKPLSKCTKKEMLLRQHVKSIMNQGKLLPDYVILELLLSRLQETDPATGFVLDGFPRTVAHAGVLDDAVGGIDMAVNFHLEEDALVAKCLGRRVCRECGKDYNLAHVDICMHERNHDGVVRRKRIFLPARLPPQECASKLEVRADDSSEDVVRERVHAYACESKPLEDYYHAQGRLVDVNVGPGAGFVWSRLLDVIGDLERSKDEVAASPQ